MLENKDRDYQRQKPSLQERIRLLNEKTRYAPPEMKKETIIAPPHTEKYNLDGSLNLQYHIQGAGVTYSASTGESVMFFEGTPFFPVAKGESRVYPRSAIYGARSNDNWKTITFFDPLNETLAKRDSASPLFLSAGESSYAPHGQEDPRVTKLLGEGYFWHGNLIVANAINRVEQRKTFKETRNLSLPLKGATPELYLAFNLADPKSYTQLGRIGPGEFFKNVIIHPALLNIRGEPHVLVYGRKLPGIQGFTIPLVDFPLLINDEVYRKKYWDEQLRPKNVEKATILKPQFNWEAKGDQYNPDGQVSGGAPVLNVVYTDISTGKPKDAWLSIYNAVPEFDENYYSLGRVVGAALLDYDNPRRVIARSPLPIIWPTERDEISEGRHPNTTFATGAYIDREGILRIFYSAGGKNIAMASCQSHDMTDYLSKFTEIGEIHKEINHESPHTIFIGKKEKENTSLQDIELDRKDLELVHESFLSELRSAYISYKKGEPNTSSIPFSVINIPSTGRVSVGENFGVFVLGGTFGSSALCQKTTEGIQILDIGNETPLPRFTALEELSSFIVDSFKDIPQELVINSAYFMKQMTRDGITDGILQNFAKSLHIESLLGKPFGEEVEHSIFSKTGKNTRISVGSDGLCLLLAGKNDFPSDELAFGIVGTGFNFGFFVDGGLPVTLESYRFKLPLDSSSSKSLNKFGTAFGKQVTGESLYRRYNDVIQEMGKSMALLTSTEELNRLSTQTIPVASEIAKKLLRRSAQLIACQVAGIANFKEHDMVFTVEGSLLTKGYKYQETVEQTVQELSPYRVSFVQIPHSGIVGAAQLVI